MLRVQEAGIDVRLGEIAGAIQETMESYEVEIDGKVLPGECAVKNVRISVSLSCSQAHREPQWSLYRPVSSTCGEISMSREE